MSGNIETKTIYSTHCNELSDDNIKPILRNFHDKAPA